MKMSNSKSNFPQMQLEEMEKPVVQQMVTDLRQLYDMGRPQSNAELEERINSYFEFCQNSAIRPGIESLCLALHISRTTLFNWSRGSGCDRERQEIAECAKSFVSAFLEQAALSGRISPPTGIFLLKNWCSYKDAYSFENLADDNSISESQILSREEIASRHAVYIDAPEPEKPEL